jgi:hypothetical protein
MTAKDLTFAIDRLDTDIQVAESCCQSHGKGFVRRLTLQGLFLRLSGRDIYVKGL